MGFIPSILGGNANTFRAKTPTNTFQATPADLNTTDYSDAIAKAMGAGTGGPVADQQTALAQALTAAANGTGPSLAQDQLRQATEQGNQEAAGAIASARGVNPAMAARMILDAQAKNNQVAAGQSATTRAQEQLASRGLLAQALAAQRGGDISQQGANASTLGTIGGLANNQNAIQSENSLGVQGLNQRTAAENAQNDMEAQKINADVAKQNAASSGSMLGGLLGAGGSILGGALGGPVGSVIGGKLAGGLSSLFHGSGDSSGGGGNGGSASVGDMPFGVATGGEIPGKARVAGDSSKNDVVPAMVSPGEIVLPRTVTQAPNAAEKARAFVAAIKAKSDPAPQMGYGGYLAKQRELEARLKKLESRIGKKAA